jgi:hypothetical protein
MDGLRIIVEVAGTDGVPSTELSSIIQEQITPVLNTFTGEVLRCLDRSATSEMTRMEFSISSDGVAQITLAAEIKGSSTM